jgi:hypothetical protein
MSDSPLHFVFDLLTELRERIPPQEGMRHNITLTYDERLELTIVGKDYPHRVFMFEPDEDKDMSPTDIVDFIHSTLMQQKLAEE